MGYPIYSKDPSKAVVWIYDTFDNTLEIKNGFIKYLMVKFSD